jgi:hypothetical protein
VQVPGFAAIFAATGASVYAGLRWRWRVWAGVAAGVVGYLGTAAIVGLITAWVVGYPVWLGIRL